MQSQSGRRNEAAHTNTFLCIIGVLPITDTQKGVRMHSTTLPFSIQLPDDLPFAFSIQALAERLTTLVDKRKARGVRYPLAVLLTVAVLAKLAGHTRIEPMADWARLRAAELAHLFGLPRAHMPHQTTWSRVLGSAVDAEQFERVLSQFFAEAVATAEVRERASVVLAVDGKTLRGTIPSGHTRGVHLVAAYLPSNGVVLAQMAVDSKENEIVAVPRLLSTLDLKGIVVIGDAMQTQRQVSIQIVQDQGDFVWFVKENQPTLLSDLELLFTPPLFAKGFSLPPNDFTTARCLDKRHGRVEERILTLSRELHEYADWPYIDQVFRLERRVVERGKETVETRYGITSLPPQAANAARLLEITRAEWGIENGLHYRRDVTLQEDACQFRRGRGPQVLAAVHNAVIGLVARAGLTNLAAAQRTFDHALDRLLARLDPPPTSLS